VVSNHRPPPCKGDSRESADLGWSGNHSRRTTGLSIDAFRRCASFFDLSRNLCGISARQGPWAPVGPDGPKSRRFPAYLDLWVMSPVASCRLVQSGAVVCRSIRASCRPVPRGSAEVRAGCTSKGEKSDKESVSRLGESLPGSGERGGHVLQVSSLACGDNPHAGLLHEGPGQSDVPRPRRR